jgi:PPM family protein phosphatase
MTSSAALGLLAMRFLPSNAQHIGARHSQQDSFGFGDPDDATFISHGGFLAVVCDGMGGMEHGDAASRTAVRAFLDAYCCKTPGESIPSALERSVREANTRVVLLAHSLGVAENLGTTLVATALRGDSLYFISVGDSGLFHCSNGRIQTLNRPHVFANLLEAAVARGTLSREDAERHPERESLTSYIGAEPLEEIDRNVDPRRVSVGDTVLLASDGLFKTLEPAEMLACLQGPPNSWPETLVERTLAKNRESQDNVTVLSITIEPESRAVIPDARQTAPPASASASVPPAKSRKMWLLVAAVLLIAGCAAAGWWYFKIRP